VAAAITTSVPYIRPTAHGSLVEWIHWPSGGAAAFWRRRADLSEPAEQVLEGLSLFGPSATTGISIVAAQEAEASGAMILQGISR
jgi:hypothetical protein